MQEEIKALEENHTWSLCVLPAGECSIGCKWVYTVKTDAAGNFTHYKARLVAKGFSQREGLYYFETFALLSIAVKEDLEIAKFDLNSISAWSTQRRNLLGSTTGFHQSRSFSGSVQA